MFLGFCFYNAAPEVYYTSKVKKKMCSTVDIRNVCWFIDVNYFEIYLQTFSTVAVRKFHRNVNI
jgi:hypothetical protein